MFESYEKYAKDLDEKQINVDYMYNFRLELLRALELTLQQEIIVYTQYKEKPLEVHFEPSMTLRGITVNEATKKLTEKATKAVLDEVTNHDPLDDKVEGLEAKSHTLILKFFDKGIVSPIRLIELTKTAGSNVPTSYAGMDSYTDLFNLVVTSFINGYLNKFTGKFVKNYHRANRVALENEKNLTVDEYLDYLNGLCSLCSKESMEIKDVVDKLFDLCKEGMEDE